MQGASENLFFHELFGEVKVIGLQGQEERNSTTKKALLYFTILETHFFWLKNVIFRRKMKNTIKVLGFAIPWQQFFKCQQAPIEKTTIKFQVSIGQGSKSSLFYIFVWQGLMDFFEKIP